MRWSQTARGAFCAVVVCAASLGATADAAEKRLVRHFPTPLWCSIVSGHTSPFDLLVPYTFTPPGNRVTIVFKADNAFNNIWNNQRLDDVVVLRKADLPPGTEPACFSQPLSDGSNAIDPPAFPSNAQPAAFRDDFQTGAKAEWGAVPAGTGEGAASAPLFWLPTSSAGTAVTTDLLHEDFEDGLGQGWTSAGIAGATNLWRPAALDCAPLEGLRHLAFGRPSPACSYDVAVQGHVGGTYTSPVLDLSYGDPDQDPVISFEHRWTTSGQPQEWTVETSEDGGATWFVDLQASDRPPSSSGATVFESFETTSRSAQFRLRFRFDSGGASADSGEGWYIDEIRVNVTRAPGGSLALGRSTEVGGLLVDSGKVTARLNLTNLTPGTEYAVMARWNAIQGTQEVSPPDSVTKALTIDHVFDSTAPTNPTLSSSTHTAGVWSQSAQVGVQWSGATDGAGAGLAGYSTAFDTTAATVPNTTLETVHGSDPHSFTSATLADGGNYYFHLRTCDFALNCSGAAHLGPFRVDRTAPSAATGLTSPSHTVGVASVDRTIDVTWSPATDASSGVDGYAFTFDNSPTWVCDQTKDAEETANSTTSTTLAVGTWYFHVCTRDNAGNWSSVANLGPFPLAADTTPPVNPTLSGQSHVPNVWSKLNQVTVAWSGATDAGGSGLAGYSVAFDAAALTSPNTSIDVPHGSDPHSFTSVALADGGSYYLHLRTCDQALNCSSATHIGPFRVDQTAPGMVVSLASPSHVVGTPSPDATIDVTWATAVDASSGVDGYALAFDGNTAWPCDQVKDLEESGSGVTSPTLAAGSWYFHVCTRDNAGNWSGAASIGPFTISGGSTAVRLHTLTPCRLVDTREPAGPLSGPPLAANGDRAFPADQACGVPQTARALSANVTVVSPTAQGDLRLYPPGADVPLASTINYSPGQTRANNAILPLNASREFAVRCDQATGTVHLLVDVNGYFE